MSRIGRAPIAVPAGVEIKIEDNNVVTVKGPKATITISNQGETIPAEEQQLIFDRFHKTDHSRSADRDGVGLGLYIVKTILNSHKENITCTSEDGVTKFVFTLTRA